MSRKLEITCISFIAVALSFDYRSASDSYCYTVIYKCYHLYLFTLDVSYVLQIAEFVYGMLLMVAWCIH
jgi:hypothetical protein